MQQSIEQMMIPSLGDVVINNKTAMTEKNIITGRHGNKYTSNIEKACDEVNSDALTIEQAAKKYGVSESKLSKILKV